MSFAHIHNFEHRLCELTGAPFAIMTDCCTHAIELCLRYDAVTHTRFTPRTYISIPMTMHKLGITYSYDANEDWVGEYNFEGTRIWDSARLCRKDMYKAGQMQCLSFGYSKPLEIGHGGAILLDDEDAYNVLIRQRYDGRDLHLSPWESQGEFTIGYHYRPTPEDALAGLQKIRTFDQTPKYHQYPDLREIIIK